MRRTLLSIAFSFALLGQALAASTSYQATLGSGAGFGAWCVGGTGASCSGGAFWPGTVITTSGGAELFTSGNAAYVQFPSAQAVTATLQASATTAIGKVDPNTIATWGLAPIGGTTGSPANALAAGCQYNASVPTFTTGDVGGWQCTINGSGHVTVDNSLNALINSADSITPVSTVTATAGASPVNSYLYGFDGTNWDRLRVDSNFNLKTVGAVNQTPTACSGTITAGGTAQNIIAANAAIHGFIVANIDPTTGSGEPLWISFTTTAAASGTDSYPMAAPTATTFAGLSSFTTPAGFGSNHAVSLIGATTGHKFSCTYW
jgi:hypothetical protein